jgi:hypothetical protein
MPIVYVVGAEDEEAVTRSQEMHAVKSRDRLQLVSGDEPCLVV